MQRVHYPQTLPLKKAQGPLAFFNNSLVYSNSYFWTPQEQKSQVHNLITVFLAYYHDGNNKKNIILRKKKINKETNNIEIQW